MNFAANPVVAGLVPVISIGCLLTGIASFASAVRVGMAGTRVQFGNMTDTCSET
jgi:hypothetical protein